MIQFRWILSILFIPLSWTKTIPLIRPNRIEWNPNLIPQKVRIRDHSIFYVKKGEGRPLILIHGYGAGMWVWEKQIDLLSQSYSVYALDLIGHGFSDRPKIPYKPETYIHFLKDFMDGLGIEKATLIGNSMGGGIAWAFSLFYPERVEKLILIDCVPPDVLKKVKNDSFRTLAAIKDIPFLPYLLFLSRSRISIRWILHECVLDKKLITEEIIDRQYLLTRIKGSTWVLYSTFKNAKEAERLKDHLHIIKKPTLLIWGERDLIFPPVIGESLHRTIEGSRFQIIEESGHIPMWERPDPVNRAILSFLNS